MKHKLAAPPSTFKDDSGKVKWEAMCTCGAYREAKTKQVVLLMIEDHQLLEQATAR